MFWPNLLRFGTRHLQVVVLTAFFSKFEISNLKKCSGREKIFFQNVGKLVMPVDRTRQVEQLCSRHQIVNCKHKSYTLLKIELLQGLSSDQRAGNLSEVFWLNLFKLGTKHHQVAVLTAFFRNLKFRICMKVLVRKIFFVQNVGKLVKPVDRTR